jgi:excisionase family DNA binding protein
LNARTKGRAPEQAITGTKIINNEPLAVSIGEAARLAGVSRSTLYAEMIAGRLAYAKVGKRRVIPVEALTAWLQAATTEVQ